MPNFFPWTFIRPCWPQRYDMTLYVGEMKNTIAEFLCGIYYGLFHVL